MLDILSGDATKPAAKVRGASRRMRESARHPMPPAPFPADEAIPAMRESAIGTMPIGGETAFLIETARKRAIWLNARNRLYLHALSICRSYSDGDKAEAVKLYQKVAKGEPAPAAVQLTLAPFVDEIERWDDRVKSLEKLIVQKMADLPIAADMKAIKGIGALNLSAVIARTGPFDNYPTVAKLWRALGLGVSGDGLSREDPITPGKCNKKRHLATARVLADGMLKASDPQFRAVYDREKAKALAKEWPKARAHAHALRVGVKHILRRLWRAWHVNAS